MASMNKLEMEGRRNEEERSRLHSEREELADNPEVPKMSTAVEDPEFILKGISRRSRRKKGHFSTMEGPDTGSSGFSAGGRNLGSPEEITAGVEQVIENKEEPVSLDLEFGLKKKKPKSARKRVLLETIAPKATVRDKTDDLSDEEEPMSYDQLLKRLCEIKVTDGRGKAPEKLIIPLPVVTKCGRLRTTYLNFLDAVRSFHRSPSHVLAFFNSELGTVCTLKSNNTLWIRGGFRQQHINKILLDYANKYVLCPACKSPDTLLRKTGRINVISCDKCDAKFAVKNITNGYRANVKVR